jgi:DNA-binding CsgD family transcriptional regulator
MRGNGETAEAPAWAVGDLEIRTLGLLIEGVPDKAVANRLGVSHRTVQRHVREMMARSGASNRMQLGRQAARSDIPDHLIRAANPPDDTGIRLLWLLLMDLPRTALPRSLGMSTRSIERLLQDLMTMAGAASRVQLGWNVTRLGWI